jgi:hypothetical protein
MPAKSYVAFSKLPIICVQIIQFVDCPVYKLSVHDFFLRKHRCVN